MSKRFIIPMAIAVTLAAVSITLVVVGVLRHSETGLLRGCFEQDGSVSYSADCDEITWEQHQIPLKVSTVDRADTFSDSDKALKGAINRLNQKLGFKLFQHTYETGYNTFRFHVPYQQGFMDASEDVRHVKTTNGDLRAYGRVCNVEDVPMLGLVLEHGLLHMAGLGHDDYDSSIMRAKQPLEVALETMPRISDHDRELLQRLYHKNQSR